MSIEDEQGREVDEQRQDAVAEPADDDWIGPAGLAALAAFDQAENGPPL